MSLSIAILTLGYMFWILKQINISLNLMTRRKYQNVNIPLMQTGLGSNYFLKAYLFLCIVYEDFAWM